MNSNLHSTMVLLKWVTIVSNYISDKRSTFHYGSIKMSFTLKTNLLHLNLHSTMVLLKFINILSFIEDIYNLHSTMVLLKLLHIVISSSKIKSTFHYGSIKIIRTNENIWTEILSTFHYGSIKI